VYKDISSLKLSFEPARFSSGTLVAIAAAGTIVGKAWTGSDRYYRIEGAGDMRLSETDLGATGGKFYMLKESVNTRVGGKPAISKVFSDEDGRTVEEILWVSGRKLYLLTFAPEMSTGGARKQKIAPSVSAYSLAQELR